jgi:hypothetical protein
VKPRTQQIVVEAGFSRHPARTDGKPRTQQIVVEAGFSRPGT